MSRHRIAAVKELDSASGHEFAIAGRIVALFHVDGTWYAMDGICLHSGGPLANGAISGCVVTCPWHGWQFDVTTGKHQLNDRFRQPTFPVEIEDGSIYVTLPDPE